MLTEARQLFEGLARLGSFYQNDPSNLLPRLFLLAQFDQTINNIPNTNLLRRYVIARDMQLGSLVPRNGQNRAEIAQYIFRNGYSEDANRQTTLTERLHEYHSWCSNFFTANKTMVVFFGHGSGVRGLIERLLLKLKQFIPEGKLPEILENLLQLLAVQDSSAMFKMLEGILEGIKMTDLEKDEQFRELIRLLQLVAPLDTPKQATTIISNTDGESILTIPEYCETLRRLKHRGRTVDVVVINSCNMLNLETAYELSLFNENGYLIARSNKFSYPFQFELWSSWLSFLLQRHHRSRISDYLVNTDEFLRWTFFSEVVSKKPWIVTEGRCDSFAVVNLSKCEFLVQSLDRLASRALTNNDYMIKAAECAKATSITVRNNADLLEFLLKLRNEFQGTAEILCPIETAIRAVREIFKHLDQGQRGISVSPEFDFRSMARNADSKYTSLGIYLPNATDPYHEYHDPELSLYQKTCWLKFANQIGEIRESQSNAD